MNVNSHYSSIFRLRRCSEAPPELQIANLKNDNGLGSQIIQVLNEGHRLGYLETDPTEYFKSLRKQLSDGTCYGQAMSVITHTEITPKAAAIKIKRLEPHCHQMLEFIRCHASHALDKDLDTLHSMEQHVRKIKPPNGDSSVEARSRFDTAFATMEVFRAAVNEKTEKVKAFMKKVRAIGCDEVVQRGNWTYEREMRVNDSWVDENIGDLAKDTKCVRAICFQYDCKKYDGSGHAIAIIMLPKALNKYYIYDANFGINEMNSLNELIARIKFYMKDHIKRYTTITLSIYAKKMVEMPSEPSTTLFSPLRSFCNRVTDLLQQWFEPFEGIGQLAAKINP